jgi:inhibitor of KinA sporulation pathway (predicted exonuclease)
MAARGVPFAEACATLRENFMTKSRVWASWGEYDRFMFERQCRSFGVPYPFSARHINVKTLFAILYGLDREVGMAQALEMRGLALEGTHHRADSDAWNVAGLLCELIINLRKVN